MVYKYIYIMVNILLNFIRKKKKNSTKKRKKFFFNKKKLAHSLG